MNQYRWMYNSKKIVEELSGYEIGEKKDVIINNVSTLDEPLNHSMVFVGKKKWKMEYADKLNELSESFLILENDVSKNLSVAIKNNHVIEVRNARLYFAKALAKILKDISANRRYRIESNNIVIGENVIVGKNCSIEPFVFIDHDVEIGSNVNIKSGAKIRSNVIVKNNVVIGENSVIGAQGFGIESDEDGRNIRIPHIGGVIIGENVEIGALTSVVSGTIKPTIIEKKCMVDDLNHIAHNCILGAGTWSTGCVEFSGSARIGRNGYISPNATIRNGMSLGDNCFIGQASSVQKSFGDNVNLVGNPAKIFNKK